MAPPPPSAAKRRSAFLERLAVYLIGVAIGCLIVGMIVSARNRHLAPAVPDTSTPPVPAAPSPQR